jgi:hypothetical protein
VTETCKRKSLTDRNESSKISCLEQETVVSLRRAFPATRQIQFQVHKFCMSLTRLMHHALMRESRNL